MPSSALPVKVFATTGSDGLARDVCSALQRRLPTGLQPTGCLTLGWTHVTRFDNGNLQVQVENVRGHFIVVIHTQVPPVSEGLIELLALLDAIRNAGPADILLVFPYMPDSRSDRKDRPRISTMAPFWAKVLNRVLEVKRVLLLDPHDTHIKHYFDPAADEITAVYLLADYLERNVFNLISKEKTVVVFPDAGAAKRFSAVAGLLRLPVAYIDKDRNEQGEPQVRRVVGDISGKVCIMIDDEILTGGTSVADAQALLDLGADLVYMLAVHAVLESNKLSRSGLMRKLEDSSIKRFIVTDSVPVSHKIGRRRRVNKFTVLSVASLLAEAIARTVLNESLTALHQPENVHLYRR